MMDRRRKKQVQHSVALLLCYVLLLPAAALGDRCRDECIASGCNSLPLICRISCSTACMGQTGLLSLNPAAPDNLSVDDARPPSGGHVSVLRGLKPAPDEEANHN